MASSGASKTCAFLGDWGLDTSQRRRVFHVLSELHPGGVVVLGDNAYPNGYPSKEPKPEPWHVSVPCPWYGVLGNHDHHSDPSWQFHRGTPWEMPSHYYSRWMPEISCYWLFVDTCIMDPEYTTDIMVSAGVAVDDIQRFQQRCRIHQEKQWEWLSYHLKHRPVSCSWTIVCGHYPIYSVGPHIDSIILSTRLLPLLRRFSVDFYFAGHNHNAQVLQDPASPLLHIISGAVCTTTGHPFRSSPLLRFFSESPGFFRLTLSPRQADLTYLDAIRHASTHHHLFLKN